MLVIEKAGKGTKNFVYIQIFKRKSEKFMYFVRYMTHSYFPNPLPPPKKYPIIPVETSSTF